MSAQDELVSKINALLLRKYGNSAEPNQKRLFETYDKDLDGKIDSKELEGLLRDADVGNAITRGAWVRGIMGRMDTDRDGKICWDEYRRALQLA
jgi:Ca2+-binding EF-hand superfamily protein